jgi:hypothetical protein
MLMVNTPPEVGKSSDELSMCSTVSFLGSG